MTGSNTLTALLILLAGATLIALLLRLGLWSRDRKARARARTFTFPILIHHGERHDDKLVRKYNELASNGANRRKIDTIVAALMRRDRHKFDQAQSVRIDEYKSDEDLVDKTGQQYLEQIAEDSDIETIIGFLE